MSKFYGTLNTDAGKHVVTKTGHHWVKATAQSWDGSVSVELEGHATLGVLFELRVERGSTPRPDTVVLRLTLAQLLDAKIGGRLGAMAQALAAPAVEPRPDVVDLQCPECGTFSDHTLPSS